MKENITNGSKRSLKKISSDSSKILLIVESPKKAKTIQGYLPKNYQVVASQGHIRHIPSRNNSIVIKEQKVHFEWEDDEKKTKPLKKIVEEYNQIILATDMDREGEAIAWHLQNLLRPHTSAQFSRITFVEITEQAIHQALQNQRELNIPLVQAYLTRVGLDYLLGFGLSPVLWQKFSLFRNQSAGRVQSPSLRLICEREDLRKEFSVHFYYSIECNFENHEAILHEYKGNKVTPRLSKTEGEDLLSKVPHGSYQVTKIEKKVVNLAPPAPFITSTLQQEAHSKLNLEIAKTMKICQQMYEGITIEGKNIALITYMRTDSTNIGEEALKQIRSYLDAHMSQYLPDKPNKYIKKVKNAQEAHECIRPTDIDLTPEMIKNKVEEDIYHLYELIWIRTLSSQMKKAIRENIFYYLKQDQTIWLLSSSKIIFESFLQFTSYKNREVNLKEGDSLLLSNLRLEEHETQPPAHFNEGTLVKKLEELGIGRPSTQASICPNLKEREYIASVHKHLEPSLKGYITSDFLRKYFSQYIDYEFTAALENKLDSIAKGQEDFEKVIVEYYYTLQNRIEEVKNIALAEILQFISPRILGSSKVCECGGTLLLRYKFSFFSVCESCGKINKIGENKEVLLSDLTLVATDKYKYLTNGEKKRVYLPRNFHDNLTQEQMMFLFELPKNISVNNQIITLGVNSFGFFAQHGTNYLRINNINDLMFNHELIYENLSKVVPKIVELENAYYIVRGEQKTIIPANLMKNITEEQKKFLLSLPIIFNYDNKKFKIGLGRFGLFVKYEEKYISCKNFEKAMQPHEIIASYFTKPTEQTIN